MNQERNQVDLEQNFQSWEVRDNLFKPFVSEVYEGRLSNDQIEKARKLKFEGTKIPFVDKVSIAATVIFHRLTPKKQESSKEKLLSQLTEDERQVVETSLGLNICGIALDRNEVSEQLSLKPEEVDIFIASSHEKLFPLSPNE